MTPDTKQEGDDESDYSSFLEPENVSAALIEVSLLQALSSFPPYQSPPDKTQKKAQVAGSLGHISKIEENTNYVPWMTPSQAQPGPEKPRAECLTCVNKDLVCDGFIVVEGMCERCVKEGGEDDFCYWEQDEDDHDATCEDTENFLTHFDSYDQTMHELLNAQQYTNYGAIEYATNLRGSPSARNSATDFIGNTTALQSHSAANVTIRESSVLIENLQKESKGHAQEQANLEPKVHNSKAVETAASSKHGVKKTLIESKDLQSIAKEPSTVTAKNASRNEQQEPVRLMFFEDDVTQYDGDKLWTGMLERCQSQFKGPCQGKAFISLQRLRQGKSDAKTEFKSLCELCGYDPTFCRMLQHYLGILESYRGGSLLKAPFDIFKSPQPAVSTKKPQGRCLTCIEKGRPCRLSHTIGGTCHECHTDKVNNRLTSEADTCYWVHESHGILTYPDAVDFFGYNNEAVIVQKRKATDDEDSSRPKKRARKTKRSTAITEFFQTPDGPYPIRLEHCRLPEPERGLEPKEYHVAFVRKLFDAQGVQLTKINSMVFLEKYTGIRVALEWSMWDLIKYRRLVRDFTGCPRYSFSYRYRDGPIKEIDESWFLSQDRAIRRGIANFKDAAFYCEARPPVGAP